MEGTNKILRTFRALIFLVVGWVFLPPHHLLPKGAGYVEMNRVEISFGKGYSGSHGLWREGQKPQSSPMLWCMLDFSPRVVL